MLRLDLTMKLFGGSSISNVISAVNVMNSTYLSSTLFEPNMLFQILLFWLTLVKFSFEVRLDILFIVAFLEKDLLNNVYIEMFKMTKPNDQWNNGSNENNGIWIVSSLSQVYSFVSGAAFSFLSVQESECMRRIKKGKREKMQ